MCGSEPLGCARAPPGNDPQEIDPQERETAMSTQTPDALASIAPGSKVTIKVVTRPSTAAATKTVVRLLSKDQVVKDENERLRKSRKTSHRTKQRGGRQWNIWTPKIHPVDGSIGETGTIVASLDVLTDLRSVAKFVEITKA
jgi:hypothetical protein